jgi:hypothetical protein
MAFLDSITDLINKFIPSRKAALVDRLNTLTVNYMEALRNGNDTLAASIRVQLDTLRKKVAYTDGDV